MGFLRFLPPFICVLFVFAGANLGAESLLSSMGDANRWRFYLGTAAQTRSEGSLINLQKRHTEGARISSLLGLTDFQINRPALGAAEGPGAPPVTAYAVEQPELGLGIAPFASDYTNSLELGFEFRAREDLSLGLLISRGTLHGFQAPFFVAAGIGSDGGTVFPGPAIVQLGTHYRTTLFKNTSYLAGITRHLSLGKYFEPYASFRTGLTSYRSRGLFEAEDYFRQLGGQGISGIGLSMGFALGLHLLMPPEHETGFRVEIAWLRHSLRGTNLRQVHVNFGMVIQANQIVR